MTLDHFLKESPEQMPPKKKLWLELAQGMEYIHSKNLIHDSINPNSVLIFVDSNDLRKSTAKWSTSNLLLVDRVEKRETNISLTDEEAIWKAPELMTKQFVQPETVESNTFAVGLIFAYTLLGAVEHLYGLGNQTIINNVKNNRPVHLYSKFAVNMIHT